MILKLPQIKVSFFVLLFIFPLYTFSQINIWTEDFSTYANGTITGTDDRWTLTTTSDVNGTDANDYFKVVSNEMQARDVNANEQIFTTELIDISAYTNIGLKIDVFKVGGTMESNDYIKVYYKLDDGSEILFTGGSNYDDFSDKTLTETGLSGLAVQIIVKIKNDADTEIYGFDTIIVEGTPIEPEINVQGNGIDILNGNTSISKNDNTDFGIINVSSSVSKTFIIQNLGSSTLNLTGNPIVEISGASEFTAISQPSSSSISGTSSSSFVVEFSPTSEGTFSGTIIINNDDSDESIYQFSIQASAEQNFFDSDGDGIFDNVDIDDDNDGIRDEEEENTCKNSAISVTANYKFLNETFGAGTNRTTIDTNYDTITTYCYEEGTSGTNTATCSNLSDYSLNDGEYTVGSSTQIASWASEYWFLGGDHTGDVNGRMAIFNASYDPGIFYTATISGALPNVPITYSFWVLNIDRSDAPGIESRLRPDILVEFRDIDDNLLASITTGDIPPTTAGNLDGDWYQFSADLTLNVNEFYVYFINNETGGLGNDLAIDDIEISQTLCDTDSDGVADVFDLDSDNDGIPDVVEIGLGDYSGGTATLSGTWVDNNSNGMHDLAESHTVLDSDGDGTPNYLDLDSDNDSIFDVDESGAGNSADVNFQNGDGDISGDGVGDGSDTDLVRETDINSDGILEYFPDGILDIYDYYNGSTFNTAYGNENQGVGFTYYVKDTDNDGLPDYIDTDSNNDEKYDIETTLYANLDTDYDGIIDDTNDTDGDGIVDLFDTDETVFGSPRDLDDKFALYFDGRNDFIEEDGEDIVNGLSEATMMAWVKLDSDFSNDGAIMGQNNFWIRINATKRLRVEINDQYPLTAPDSTMLSLNIWTHVAVVYNGSDTEETVKLYVNGEKVASRNEDIQGGINTSTNQKFRIGRTPSSLSFDTGEMFKGEMDELRVFNKALSDEELQKMVYQELDDTNSFNRGAIIPLDISSTIGSNLIRYYKMDVYKDDILDNKITPSPDLTGAKIYNVKNIFYQTAPLPFETKSNGNWSDSATWLNGDVLDIADETTNKNWIIAHVKNNLTTSYPHRTVGLIVNNGSELSIQSNQPLYNSWYLELDGVLDLEGESQLIQTEGSILDADSGGYIERDQQGTASSYNYNYWSSSVSTINTAGISTRGTGVSSEGNQTYTVKSILLDGTDSLNPLETINFKSEYYAADGAKTNPLTLSTYWLWKFNGTNSNYGEWKKIDENTVLEAGEGYTMKGISGTASITDEQNYVFKGRPNNGTITLSIELNKDRLIGNPYPSVIDADEFIKDNIKDGGRASTNIINGAIYFWHHFAGKTHYLSGYEGGYATYTLTGGVQAYATDERIKATGNGGGKIPERYIPLNQGFFVTTALNESLTAITTVTGGDIVFKNSQRAFKLEGETENNDGSLFFKGSKKAKSSETTANTDTRQRIWLLFDSPTGYHRQILVGTDENATKEFDLGYDAIMIDKGNEDMFWLINEGEFVIQGIDNFNKNQEIPLGLVISETGLARITIDKLENVEESEEIYIKDNTTGETYQINGQDFEIELEAGEYLDRFALVFQPRLKTIEEVALEEGITLYMDNQSSELYVKKIVDTTITGISVYNYLGQSISNLQSNFNQREFSVPISKTPTGVYVVQLTTGNGSIIKKVVIQ